METWGSVDGVTEILQCLREGDQNAAPRLMSAVYGELRAIAGKLMRAERRDHTLQPSALVHEAYLRLVSVRDADWKDRAHFFAVAAQVMRHILVDYARQRRSGKRGGGIPPLDASLTVMVAPEKLEDLLVLEDLLERLEAEDPRAAKVVVYRFFGGLTVEEIAAVMQLSTRSVKRDWSYGRAWLKARLSPRVQHAEQQSKPA